MIKKNLWALALTLLSISTDGFSQATVTVENNYNNWNWDNVHVAKNPYISIAIVPDAAGRMLEYNLGSATSLWVNPNLFGQKFTNNDEVNGTADWRNFGGFRLVAIPRNTVAVNKDGKTNRWPPPVVIGDSPYTVSHSLANGKHVINAISGIQELPVPTFDRSTRTYFHPTTIDEELQYERDLYIDDETSLVHINHKLHNRGTQSVNRGIMTTSQHISRSAPLLEDGENFVAYIPFSENLKLPNGEQYHIGATAQSHWNFVNRNRMPLDMNNQQHLDLYYNNGTNWTGEVAPGIFELHYDYYIMSEFQIISSKAWICFVNKTNNTAFAKMFQPLDKSKTYEYGINMSIYNSALETGYLETEVKTPIETIAPGAFLEYSETQAAAKIASTPVLDVNRTGVITQKLSYTPNTQKLNGKFGVFVAGRAFIRVLNNTNPLEEIQLENVTPLKALVIDKTIIENANTTTYQLLIEDTSNVEHLLDTFSTAALSTEDFSNGDILSVTPNPFINKLNINTINQNYQVDLYDLKGKKLKTIKNLSDNQTIDYSNFASGIYFLKVQNESSSKTLKVIKK
ncbi:hypothetical protein A8C32_17455 [Flavivirga aquatica]|uniref:Secretion system C-terminal sorting domain-containing protein n=1 Tax=Flavivirga aquatica TaxID=1849968 RepID=A0A1E5T882_9FLAO|nr:T9SS type A sorting domain-containing protein [Flavivirga aquatica]OEK07584.1 hypothetical protein A8C32_17455 [Flavivirga aquatica]